MKKTVLEQYINLRQEIKEISDRIARLEQKLKRIMKRETYDMQLKVAMAGSRHSTLRASLWQRRTRRSICCERISVCWKKEKRGQQSR